MGPAMSLPECLLLVGLRFSESRKAESSVAVGAFARPLVEAYDRVVELVHCPFCKRVVDAAAWSMFGWHRHCLMLNLEPDGWILHASNETDLEDYAKAAQLRALLWLETRTRFALGPWQIGEGWRIVRPC